MDLLRHALSILVDAQVPIEKRLDQLLPHGKAPIVPRLGRAVLTAILQVEYPDEYGVWNGTSEGALKTLKIWPTFDSNDSFGQRYLRVNEILLFLAAELQIDLWTLDSVWWGVKGFKANDLGPTDGGAAPCEESRTRFVLERYLQAFLEDNWDKTALGKEWALYEEDGEVVASQYKAGAAGTIDLLARNGQKHKWLVVELKKGQSSDQTLGQVLRYMGWVEENLARGESVEGLIIAEAVDERLRLALRNTRNINVLLYEVDFHLRDMQHYAKQTSSTG
jgi:CRISPR/Cas system-associated exonuclease Cas4 (RecB family)